MGQASQCDVPSSSKPANSRLPQKRKKTEIGVTVK